jgi:PTH1 family peptidyl-tRNA hydrolase
MIYTLVPLGNPGEKYLKTRHNIARIVFEMIKEDVEKVNDVEVFVPETFMNESGTAVAEYMRYHEGREMVVMYDDKDLPFGTFRIAFDRSSGGHNGLQSVIEGLGKMDFVRIRVGIAPKETDGKEIIPPHGKEVQDYVLDKIKEDEEEELRKIAPDILGAITLIAKGEYTKAMEKYN